MKIPGVGYDAVARGLRRTFYDVNNLGNARVGLLNPAVQLVDASAGAMAARASWEGRYGAGASPFGANDPMTGQPADDRLKRWSKSPNNEVRDAVVQGLVWMFENRAEELGSGGQGDFSGVPTEQEITDAQAVGDATIWHAYHLTLPGWTEGNPAPTIRQDKPPGAFKEWDPFWSRWVYWLNEYAGPVDPPADDPPADDPPADDPPPAQAPGLSDPVVRAEELASLLQPVWQSFRGGSFFTKRLPVWSVIWPTLRPVVVEGVKAARRYALRLRVPS